MLKNEILQIMESQTGMNADGPMHGSLPALSDMGLEAHQIKELIQKIGRHFNVELVMDPEPEVQGSYDTLTLMQIERSVEEELLHGNGLA